jgi:hypothetical protein
MILAADFAPCLYWAVICFIALLIIEYFECRGKNAQDD